MSHLYPLRLENVVSILPGVPHGLLRAYLISGIGRHDPLTTKQGLGQPGTTCAVLSILVQYFEFSIFLGQKSKQFQFIFPSAKSENPKSNYVILHERQWLCPAPKLPFLGSVKTMALFWANYMTLTRLIQIKCPESLVAGCSGLQPASVHRCVSRFPANRRYRYRNRHLDDGCEAGIPRCTD